MKTLYLARKNNGPRRDWFPVAQLGADEEARKEQASWQEGWTQACGVWKDREDIESYIADYRAELDARIDDLKQ